MQLLQGKVIAGKKRGRLLGFPTANIAVTRNHATGVYISTTLVDEISYQSITFIGKALTFGETQSKIETHLFNFEGNIYGKEIQVTVLKKIRSNHTFASAEELATQIRIDIEQARDYFASLKL